MTARDEYLLGSDLLGASAGAIVVQVRDVGKLVREQGGVAGAAAFGLAPVTVTRKVLDEMAAEFRKKFQEKGINADVTVASTAPTGIAPRGDFLAGLAVGAGGLGILGGLAMGLRYLFKRRSGR